MIRCSFISIELLLEIRLGNFFRVCRGQKRRDICLLTSLSLMKNWSGFELLQLLIDQISFGWYVLNAVKLIFWLKLLELYVKIIKPDYKKNQNVSTWSIVYLFSHPNGVFYIRQWITQDDILTKLFWFKRINFTFILIQNIFFPLQD